MSLNDVPTIETGPKCQHPEEWVGEIVLNGVSSRYCGRCGHRPVMPPMLPKCNDPEHMPEAFADKAIAVLQDELRKGGYAVVKVGEVPPWMQGVDVDLIGCGITDDDSDPNYYRIKGEGE